MIQKCVLYLYTHVLHRGFGVTSVYRAIVMVDVGWAVSRLIERLYIHNPRPIHPLSDKTKKQIERNETIKARYASGESIQRLAAEYGISEQRIHQILKDRRK
jgi:phosphoenolpyruvate synthase/pyruvate phosphate dikinase